MSVAERGRDEHRHAFPTASTRSWIGVDADHEDFGQRQVYLTGTGYTTRPPGCDDADLDGDQDVDPDDMNLFLACMSGAEVPVEPGCDE